MTSAVLVTLTVDEALQVAAACPKIKEYLVSRVRDTVGHTHGCELWDVITGGYSIRWHFLVSNKIFVENWGCTSDQMHNIPVFDCLVESMGCLDSGLL